MSERLSAERIAEIERAVDFGTSLLSSPNDTCIAKLAFAELIAELRSLRAECEALTERLVALRTGAALGGKDAK